MKIVDEEILKFKENKRELEFSNNDVKLTFPKTLKFKL